MWGASTLELQKWVHNLTVTHYSSNIMSLMIWNPLGLLSYSLEIEFPQGYSCLIIIRGFPCHSASKESACNAGNLGLSPGSGRSAGEGIGYLLQYSWASHVAQLVKNSPAMWETWVGKILWRRERLPTPVFWPGEVHGLTSPWGCKDYNMSEQFSLTHWAFFQVVKLFPTVYIRLWLYLCLGYPFPYSVPVCLPFIFFFFLLNIIYSNHPI